MTAINRERDTVQTPSPVLRLLWWFEWEALETHLLRLNEEDRYRRFGAHVSDAGIRSRARRMQRPGSVMLAALVDGKVRGTVEIDFAATGGAERSAEIALTVERAFRGWGIGSRLFAAGRLLAENRGADQLVLTTQADNGAMQRIAHNHGMEWHRDGSERAALLHLQGGTLRGWLREAALHGRALLVGEPGAAWWRGALRTAIAALLRRVRPLQHADRRLPVSWRGLSRTPAIAA
ncbi:GNAT family N-acetyltransferase [Algiphilus sp.]|uniref:GNAT family N-acetyltransferase n=1 Tax=Algiphilus sp. TaxID=1872431 RepID=UPI003B5302E9